ncbi:hypothetical protein KAR52_01055 [Candidatus Pacearchaeota archaeon]|nr:hypothetical protein [Candidatus Pacearchaeota archaeon]
MPKFNASKNFFVDSENNEVIDKRNHQKSNYNIDSKILIYEDRQKTWFFDIAEKLKRDNEAGFVVLMIATSYLESNQKYRDGLIDGSNERIRKALQRIFDNLPRKDIDKFVNKVRNGLFHDGITKKNLFITASQPEIFKSEGESMIINPHLFFDKIQEDFEMYISDLKNTSNTSLRTNFESFWNSIKG